MEEKILLKGAEEKTSLKEMEVKVLFNDMLEQGETVYMGEGCESYDDCYPC